MIVNSCTKDESAQGITEPENPYKYIVAGDKSSQNINYIDLVNDTLRVNSYSGSFTDSISIDFNNDNVMDIKFEAISSSTMQEGSARVTVISLNKTEILIDSVGPLSLISGEKIMQDSILSFLESGFMAGEFHSRSGQGSSGNWLQTENKYLGFKFFSTDNEEFFGWIRMDCFSNSNGLVVKDFAYRK